MGENVPRDILNIILEYDGQIRYRSGKYINIIPKNDARRKILDAILIKKQEILETADVDGAAFFYVVPFDKHPWMGVSYDYRFSDSDRFEICFYNYKNNRTVLKYKTVN